jgi:hypothetical protein
VVEQSANVGSRTLCQLLNSPIDAACAFLGHFATRYGDRHARTSLNTRKAGRFPNERPSPWSIQDANDAVEATTANIGLNEVTRERSGASD